jgi:hypothetical protein
MYQWLKVTYYRPYSKLQPLPLPTGPFKSISMDFIVDLPPSMELGQIKAYDAILVVVDRYTKVVKYIPCCKTIDVLELAKVFIKHWFKDQGLPKSIVLDRGSVFTSKF